MSEKEMSEEEKQKLEEEKAKAWLVGQDYAKKHFNKVAYDEAQKRYRDEAKAKELAEVIENTERGMRNELRKTRKTKQESK